MSGIGIGICSSGGSGSGSAGVGSGCSSGNAGSGAAGDWCARMSRLEGSLGSSGWEPAQAPLPSLPHLGAPSSAGAAAGGGRSPLARSSPAGTGSRRSHPPVATAWRQLSTGAGSGVHTTVSVVLLLVGGDSAADSLAPLADRRAPLPAGGSRVCDTTLYYWTRKTAEPVCVVTAGSPALVCDATPRRLPLVCVVTALWSSRRCASPLCAPSASSTARSPVSGVSSLLLSGWLQAVYRTRLGEGHRGASWLLGRPGGSPGGGASAPPPGADSVSCSDPEGSVS